MKYPKVYWTVTILFGALLTVSGGSMVLQTQQIVASVTGLGYPAYIIPILGLAKLLGVVFLVVPQFREHRLWAYHGFFYLLAGAAISHLISSQAVMAFGPLFLAALLTVSFCLDDRRE